VLWGPSRPLEICSSMLLTKQELLYLGEVAISLLKMLGTSGVASSKIWEGGKMFDFRRITLFCLEKRLSEQKMSIFSKHLGGHGPFGPPGYAYVRHTGDNTLPYLLTTAANCTVTQLPLFLQR